MIIAAFYSQTLKCYLSLHDPAILGLPAIIRNSTIDSQRAVLQGSWGLCPGQGSSYSVAHSRPGLAENTGLPLFSREIFLQGCRVPLSCLIANRGGWERKGDWLSLKKGEFGKVASVNGCALATGLSAWWQRLSRLWYRLLPCVLTKPLSSALYFDGFLILQAVPGIGFHHRA